MRDSKGDMQLPNPIEGARHTLAWVSIFIAAFMEGHRIWSRRIGSTGRLSWGLFAWINALLVYPSFVAYAPPETRLQEINATYLWSALLWLLAIQTITAFLFAWKPHSKELGRSWWGRFDPLITFLVAFAALHYCGKGVALYFIVCGFAFWLQVQLVLMRHKRTSEVIRDQRYEAAEIQHYMR